jgi:hypothetical protein
MVGVRRVELPERYEAGYRVGEKVRQSREDGSEVAWMLTTYIPSEELKP